MIIEIINFIDVMIASLKTLLSKTHWDKTLVKKKECNLNSYLQFYNEKNISISISNQKREPQEHCQYHRHRLWSFR